MEAALIEELRRSFTLVAVQRNEKDGKGYRISLKTSLHNYDLGVEYYQVQLCGVDPISGEDVSNEHIVARFDFMLTTSETDILTYHGNFCLRCAAKMQDGRLIPFRDQQISLNFPRNCPYVSYKVSGNGGFRYVELQSNCWANCEGKLWLLFDDHKQRLTLPPGTDKTLRFYVPAASDVTVMVADNLIQVRNGR